MTGVVVISLVSLASGSSVLAFSSSSVSWSLLSKDPNDDDDDDDDDDGDDDGGGDDDDDDGTRTHTRAHTRMHTHSG